MAASGYYTCYTLGHGSIPREQFLELLSDRSIELVADTRTMPFNVGPEGYRVAQWFDRDRLQANLQREGINYRWMGRRLGPMDSTGRIDGVARERDSDYQEGIEDLMELIHDFRTLILGRQPEYRSSHRNLVIAQTLMRHDIEVIHLNAEGGEHRAKADLFHASM